MNTPKYPNITDTTLVPFRAIEVQLKQFPDILDRLECPYPPGVKTILRRLLDTVGGTAPPLVEYDDDSLISEITALYQELKNTDIKGEAKDAIAMLKARADLMTKMVGLKEKALNVRDISRFQKTVVEIVHNTLTPAQREEFFQELKQYVQ